MKGAVKHDRDDNDENRVPSSAGGGGRGGRGVGSSVPAVRLGSTRWKETLNMNVVGQSIANSTLNPKRVARGRP